MPFSSMSALKIAELTASGTIASLTLEKQTLCIRRGCQNNIRLGLQ